MAKFEFCPCQFYMLFYSQCVCVSVCRMTPKPKRNYLDDNSGNGGGGGGDDG